MALLMFIRASIFPLGESQSVLQREIHICSGLHSFHIPYTKCIQALPLMLHPRKKLNSLARSSAPLSISIDMTVAICKGHGEVRKLLATDKQFHPINGVGIKLLKAGKSSALLNPNPWNPLIGVFLTVKRWF